MQEFETILDPILIPRVPGTENHSVVRQVCDGLVGIDVLIEVDYKLLIYFQYISNFMTDLGWDVEKDSFEDNTPQGRKPFENIITTLNPNVPRRYGIALLFILWYISSKY